METKQQNKKRLVRDGVLLGDWQEVSGLQLSSVTKKDTDTAMLDGLIIKGYETKFNVTNENGERYAPNCLDRIDSESNELPHHIYDCLITYRIAAYSTPS